MDGFRNPCSNHFESMNGKPAFVGIYRENRRFGFGVGPLQMSTARLQNQFGSKLPNEGS